MEARKRQPRAKAPLTQDHLQEFLEVMEQVDIYEVSVKIGRSKTYLAQVRGGNVPLTPEVYATVLAEALFPKQPREKKARPKDEERPKPARRTALQRLERVAALLKDAADEAEEAGAEANPILRPGFEELAAEIRALRLHYLGQYVK